MGIKMVLFGYNAQYLYFMAIKMLLFGYNVPSL